MLQNNFHQYLHPESFSTSFSFDIIRNLKTKIGCPEFPIMDSQFASKLSRESRPGSNRL